MSKRWTDTQIRLLVEGVRCGMSDHIIAHAVGRSERSVALKRYALGLRRGEKRPHVYLESHNKMCGRHTHELERLGLCDD